MLWGLLLALPVFFAATLHADMRDAYPDHLWFAAVALSAVVLLSLSTSIALTKADRVLWFSVALAPIYLILGVAIGLGEIPQIANTPLFIAECVSLAQTAAAALISLAFIEVTIRAIVAQARGQRVSMTSWLVRVTALVLPFAILGGGAARCCGRPTCPSISIQRPARFSSVIGPAPTATG